MIIGVKAVTVAAAAAVVIAAARAAAAAAVVVVVVGRRPLTLVPHYTTGSTPLSLIRNFIKQPLSSGHLCVIYNHLR